MRAVVVHEHGEYRARASRTCADPVPARAKS